MTTATLTPSQIREALKQAPYWVLEDELKDRAADLGQYCEDCESLREALDTGVNNVILRIGTADDFEDVMVGYKREDGTYSLNEPYNEKILDTYPVVFEELDTDEDNMTIAIFRPLGEDD